MTYKRLSLARKRTSKFQMKVLGRRGHTINRSMFWCFLFYSFYSGAFYSLPKFIGDTETLGSFKRRIFNNIFYS